MQNIHNIAFYHYEPKYKVPGKVRCWTTQHQISPKSVE